MTLLIFILSLLNSNAMNWAILLFNEYKVKESFGNEVNMKKMYIKNDYLHALMMS